MVTRDPSDRATAVSASAIAPPTGGNGHSGPPRLGSVTDQRDSAQPKPGPLGGPNMNAVNEQVETP